MPRGEFDRSERRAQTRARLLAAAAGVYARDGFDGATLDEVAAEAGLTKGAVYDHFGSKENLLLALLDEHLAGQIAEQLALFDPNTETAERPRAGAERWMAALEENPDAFRLFVEAWVHAQRDPALRSRVADGMDAWRQALMGFGARRASAQEVEVPPALLEPVATVMLALGAGLGMVKLADPDSVSPRLLGAVFVLILRALETSEDARRLLTEAAAGTDQPVRPSTASSVRLRSTPPV